MKSFNFLISAILFCAILSASSISFAHPPTSINLSYNQQDQVLSVEADHVSRDLRKHYIRKVIITKNDEEPIVTYFTRQNKPSKFESDFDIVAKPGDEITVELFCSKGGEKSETLKITAPTKQEETKANE